MKHILLTLFMLPLCFSSEKKEAFPPVIVLELFTSQGCSSCPPADELLTKVQNTEKSSRVIALSYHVDYWNYIGWKDPFSQSKFSDKQRLYSQKFNSSSIYTPQVVINGNEHFVGSDSKKMNSKLKAYANVAAENEIIITSIQNSEGDISFEYKVQGNIKNKLLRVVLVIEERVTKISRGENRNRTLKNSNIVVSESISELKSSKGTHEITIPKLVKNNDKLNLIILIQNTDLNIVGANQLNL